MKNKLIPISLFMLLVGGDLKPSDHLKTVEASTGGLIQLMQEIPSGQPIPGGMTYDDLKDRLYCKVNHNLSSSGGVTNFSNYVNSCYVDDAMYLGESGDKYKIYVSGYEGWVDKRKANTVSLKFYVDANNNLVPQSSGKGSWKTFNYTVYTTAEFIPVGSQTYNETAVAYSLEPQTHSIIEEIDSNEYIKGKEEFDYASEENAEVAVASSARSGETRSKTVLSPSFYTKENGELVHYISKGITRSNYYSKTTIGTAPSWMNEGQRYYSFDGVYFFKTIEAINPNGTGAVNQNNPFYNYYQFVPIRSASNLTANQIDAYTRSKGYTTVPTSTSLKATDSKLVNAGSIFMEAQKTYTINGALEYAMGIHESGFGRSNISVSKNNLFGMNAVDIDPSGQATGFATVRDGILTHAKKYLSWGYSDPVSDSRYHGFYLGNKGGGMNVKYASDPFWGEKIAAYYHRVDAANGKKDLDFYQLGMIQNSTGVSVYAQPNSSSKELYKTKNKSSGATIKHYPVIVIGESGDYYKIKTDTPIVNGSPSYSGTYNSSTSVGYVKKSAVQLVNNGRYTEGSVTPPSTGGSTQGSSNQDQSLIGTTIGGLKVTEGIYTGTITTDNLNVRDAAGTHGNVLGTVHLNDKVEVIEIIQTSTVPWYKIHFGGKTGYISSDYVQLVNDSVVATGTVNTNTLNVRELPTAEASKLGAVSNGQTVNILRAVAGYNGNIWLKIQYNNQIGYVSSDYVDIKNTTKPSEVNPTLIFPSETLKVEIGTTPNFKQNVQVNAGTATNISFALIEDTYNPNQLGKQTVKYVMYYWQNGVKQIGYFAREIEVIPVVTPPTLTFSKETLLIDQGTTPNFKEGVTLNKGTAVNVSYAIQPESFDPNKVGKQTVKYVIYYNNGQYRFETREVEVTTPPSLTFPKEPLVVNQGTTPDFKAGVTLQTGTSKNVSYEVKAETFDPNKVGKQTVRYVIYYNNGRYRFVDREVEVRAVINPTLSFPKETLKIPYGTTPNFKEGVQVNAGTATNISFALIEDTFNPNQVGKQTVKYVMYYWQNGVKQIAYFAREVEVLPQQLVNPTLSFPKETLKIPYGTTPNFKADVQLNAGTATNISFALIEDTFNPNQVGKQTVKYVMYYWQNGVKQIAYFAREVEVLPQQLVNPTLSFPKETLKIPYGTTPNFKADVQLNAGTATNISFALIEDTFNPNQVGKQTVKYVMYYWQNGVKQIGYFAREVMVLSPENQKVVNPTLSFPKETLKIPYGTTPNFKADVQLNAGTATNISFALIEDTFNPNQVGKQTVKYVMYYWQNGVKQIGYFAREVEVMPKGTEVKPTLVFPKETLKIPYGTTPDFKKDVILNEGTGVNVSFAIIPETFSPTKVGKQIVKYVIYYNNGQLAYVAREVEVLAK